MSRIGLAFAFAFAFALIPSMPSVAFAQAPGDVPVEEAPVEAPAPEAPPMVAPAHTAIVVVSPPAPKPYDLAKRVGVSARMVSLGLTNDSEYAGAGIAASYRINKRWEIVLALDALDAPEGPDLHSTSVEARFHFTPHKRWDWYGLVGIGALHEISPEGEVEGVAGVTRGRVHVGVGLQRRFKSWSLGAELHSVGVGPRTEAAMTATKATTPMATDDGLSGGELTVAATMFF